MVNNIIFPIASNFWILSMLLWVLHLEKEKLSSLMFLCCVCFRKTVSQLYIICRSAESSFTSTLLLFIKKMIMLVRKSETTLFTQGIRPNKEKEDSCVSWVKNPSSFLDHETTQVFAAKLYSSFSENDCIISVAFLTNL